MEEWIENVWDSRTKQDDLLMNIEDRRKERPGRVNRE